MLPYAVTIFSGAFLLFQVQPLIGKYILPWFGGGPGVWTTCMLFFQIVLLAGYAYAHLSTRLLRPRAQAILHLVLVAGALALQPITPAESWKPLGDVEPVGRMLLLLTCTLGLPYFVLSATGPLLQQWFSRANPGVSPYRLYALSNIGSLLALLSYPFFFELHFTRREQVLMWGAGLVVYALGCAWCVWQNGRAAASVDVAVTNKEKSAPETISIKQRVRWLLLPACASVLLLATTNKMCQDVAVIPFLWVLPLALYLLSFILAFDSPRWYRREPYMVALVVALVGVTWALFAGTDAPLMAQIGLYSGGLFVFCIVCHGELYRLRPHPSRLTSYYLTISAGGALGGLFVGLAAPLLFNDFLELHGGLLLCAGLFLGVVFEDQELGQGKSGRWLALVLTGLALGGLVFLVEWSNRVMGRFFSVDAIVRLRWAVAGLAIVGGGLLVVSKVGRTFRHSRAVVLFWLVAGAVNLAWALAVQARVDRGEMVYRERNFYGTLAVLERNIFVPEDHHFVLQHGRITHGLQFTDPVASRWPVSYYGVDSGIGMALTAVNRPGRHVGVIGLGTGTIVAYGRAGDRFRLYEINPAVKEVATSRFTYLKDTAAHVDVVLGDARLTMEHEPSQEFDVLALDAFSSDAIPVHLLTKEAMALYGRHLKVDGVLVVHISNRYLDLEPVVLNLAREFGYGVATVEFHDDDANAGLSDTPWWEYSSTWMLLTKNTALLETPAIHQAAMNHTASARQIPLWTDDFASLFQVLD